MVSGCFRVTQAGGTLKWEDDLMLVGQKERARSVFKSKTFLLLGALGTGLGSMLSCPGVSTLMGSPEDHVQCSYFGTLKKWA